MRTCENPDCKKELKRKHKYFCSKSCCAKIRKKGKKHALGHKKSEEFKKINSERMKGNAYLCGFKRSEEQKRKHSEFMKGRNKGETNLLWQGGTRIKYAPGLTPKIKETIRKRDNYICQLCGITEKEYGKTLDVHHKDYSDFNHGTENLTTLCRGCHNKVRLNKEFYIKHFSKEGNYGNSVLL